MRKGDRQRETATQTGGQSRTETQRKTDKQRHREAETETVCVGGEGGLEREGRQRNISGRDHYVRWMSFQSESEPRGPLANGVEDSSCVGRKTLPPALTSASITVLTCARKRVTEAALSGFAVEAGAGGFAHAFIGHT